MPTKPRSPAPKAASERMRERRARMREAGLRPVQFWVPDLRDPKVRAQIRREAAELDKHPENAALDKWIEAVYEWPD